MTALPLEKRNSLHRPAIQIADGQVQIPPPGYHDVFSIGSYIPEEYREAITSIPEGQPDTPLVQYPGLETTPSVDVLKDIVNSLPDFYHNLPFSETPPNVAYQITDGQVQVARHWKRNLEAQKPLIRFVSQASIFSLIVKQHEIC